MGDTQPSGRKRKRWIGDLLRQKTPGEVLKDIENLPARQVINPLFSFLYATDPLIKWHAVSAMGGVVSQLALKDIESARVIMRRLMWNLNDESGGIGWGSPEALGEILAQSPILSREYAQILVSYIQPGGNFLETRGLQQGALWGLGRLSHTRPAHIDFAAPLVPFLLSKDPLSRGLATWAAGPLAKDITRTPLKALTSDTTVIEIYIDETLTNVRISDLATNALNYTGSPHPPEPR